MINILTLKVGTKYSSEYVNKLNSSIRRNSTVDYKLYCYTEDPTGLDPDIIVVPLENPDEYQLQWHKLIFHQTGFGGIEEGEKCLILDIDWIIVGDMDPILTYGLGRHHFGCFERWWSNLRHFCKLNGGFQMYYMGETQYLWEEFSKNPEHWQSYYIENGFAEGPVNGEQNFIDEHAVMKLWFPMEWFAKYHDVDYKKINRNWMRDVNPDEPYVMGGNFSDTIKMVHFSNSENQMHKVNEHWIKDYWI
tara:strand:+ start:985 stop:1728 length:744 start_codon:yes stop_codon:yes gene_type:complete